MATFATRGITKIKIPVRTEDIRSEVLGLNILKRYLPSCLQSHRANADKELYLSNVYKGIQDIQYKTNPYDETNNNKTVENHALRQVNFKVDFLLGDDVQFSHKVDSNSDDLIYLERFLCDSGFHTEHREIKKDMYKMGVGVSYTQPRTDIIDENGLFVANGYNKDTEAPFVFKNVSPISNFVVYSSYIEESPIMCISLVDKTYYKQLLPIVEYDIAVWLKTAIGVVYYEFDGGINYIFDLMAPPKKQKVQAFKYLPIIEHSCNKERIGIVEINLDLFNAINFVISNSQDAIYNAVNQVIVFENIDITQEQFDTLKKEGAIKVKSTGDPSSPSKLSTIEMKFNHSDVNVFYEQRVTKAYDIAGVPLASGVTTSGGDTGKARLLGGGWENSYTITKGEIVGMKKTDYEQLKLILATCKLVPNSKVNELSASQIDMQYNINPNDNILSKAQSAMNLFNIKMPPKMILQKTGLSLDVNTDSKDWQANIESEKAEEKEKAEVEAKKAEANLIANKPIVENEKQPEKNNVNVPSD